MIMSSRAGASSPHWQKLLAEAIRDPDQLCDVLRLPEAYREPARRSARLFGLVVPWGFAARMRAGDPNDPLLRQVLPLAEESQPVAGFISDPVRDLAHQIAPGLLQKYYGRALLVTTGVCAVNCRFCFRRHFPYSQTPHALQQWEPAMAQLEADDSIQEVILSGGDPLTLTDSWLSSLADRLAEISHLQRLRIHTRLPIVLPERVNHELLAWLRAGRLRPIVVLHTNHPNELDDSSAEAIARLVHAGVLTLNQAVLLRGINDNADTLCELCMRLVDLRVQPYYLHQLDPVAGAAHFQVPERTGRRLIAELRRRLPGYAVPRYVCELEGQPSKTLLG